ncbi:MAG: hypothetical protein PHY45_05435 [Rhodocyclaceae bacterium]|nr:hypothetical protein [Rhodocyclaceae bacterium]
MAVIQGPLRQLLTAAVDTPQLCHIHPRLVALGTAWTGITEASIGDTADSPGGGDEIVPLRGAETLKTFLPSLPLSVNHASSFPVPLSSLVLVMAREHMSKALPPQRSSSSTLIH